MDGGRGVKVPVMDRRVSSIFHSVSGQVQYLLDHNRLLINEINQNHKANVPEGLTRNVMLIRELNNNIGKVVDLYANMSTNFADAFENLQEVNSNQNNTTIKHISNGGRSMPVATHSGHQHKKSRSEDFSWSGVEPCTVVNDVGRSSNSPLLVVEVTFGFWTDLALFNLPVVGRD